MSQFPMPGPTRRTPGGGGGGGFNFDFDFSKMQLPGALQSLMNAYAETMTGADYEAGTDIYGNPNVRHERGMLDIMRELAGEEQLRKRRAFSLYEDSKLADIAAAKQAMELRDWERQMAERQAREQKKAEHDRQMQELADRNRAHFALNQESFSPFKSVQMIGASSPYTLREREMLLGRTMGR